MLTVPTPAKAEACIEKYLTREDQEQYSPDYALVCTNCGALYAVNNPRQYKEGDKCILDLGDVPCHGRLVWKGDPRLGHF